MAGELIAEAEVPRGQIGTGTAFVLGGENVAMKQLEKDIAKRDKARAAGAKAKAVAIKEVGEFEAVGWHKHSSELKGMVDDVQKYFTESMIKGKNPMDASNVEEHMMLKQKMGDAKASAEYSKQIKDNYTANMKELRLNSDKYTQESIDMFQEYYEQPLMAQMAAPLPQLEIIEEETPWWEAANKITATYIDDVLEKGITTISTREADIEAITKSVGAFLQNTPEGKQAVEDFGGEQEALDYIRDNVVIPKVKKFRKETLDEPRAEPGKGKLNPDAIMGRKTFVKKVQSGDDEAIGSLLGRRFAGGTISKAWYEPTSTGAFLHVESRTAAGKKTSTKIDVNDPESFNTINIMVEGKAGEPKIGVDKMATVAEAPEFQTTDPKEQYDKLIGGLQQGTKEAIAELKGEKLQIGRTLKEVEDVEFSKGTRGPDILGGIEFTAGDLTIKFKDGTTKKIRLSKDNNFGQKELDKLLRESKIYRRAAITSETGVAEEEAPSDSDKVKKVKKW